MAVDFSKWENQFDADELKQAAIEASKNEFKPLEKGEYITKLEKLELGESSQGSPMIKAQFKITEGECKNQMIFFSQAVNTGFGLHKGNEFLRSLDSGYDIEFNGWKDYNDLILDIIEAVQEDKTEYKINYKTREYNGKTYGDPEIIQAYK